MEKKMCLKREQSIEFSVNHVGDVLEVEWVALKLHIVAVNNDQVAFIVVDPLLIPFVQSLQVIEPDGLFVVTTSLLNLCHDIGNG